MKTVLANISNSFFVRNFLRSDASKILLENGNIHLVLLSPKNKIDYYRKEFPDKLISFDVLPDVRNSKIERFFKFLETASIHTKTSYMLTKSQYLRRTGLKRARALSYIDFFERYILWHLGRFHFWRSMIRRAYSFFKNDEFRKILDIYNPDLVFLPSMIYSEDYVLARAAKKKKIKTLGMTLSWDNFYSKTLLMVPPDQLIVHTDRIVEQAKKLGDFRGKIHVTGIPQYDIYFKRQNLMPRGEFFEKIGADSSKKLLLYAFSGKSGLNIEFSVLEILYRAIKDKKIKDDVQVLLRPYPRYDFPKEKFNELKEKYKFLIVQPVFHTGEGKGDWEFNEDAVELLANSLAHSDLVINMYSTFFIEAAIFDKPLVAIGFDGEKNFEYWNSAVRFFDWEHLAQIGKTNGIARAKNPDQLSEFINRCLSDPQWLGEGRRELVLQQCQFTDGKSGERLAKTILGAL